MTEQKDAKSASALRAVWWCRKFGHAFVQRTTVKVDATRWLQPGAIPLVTYCRRCGIAPEPSSGGCTATGKGIRDGAPLFCGLREGHRGSHHDPATGADWWQRQKPTASGEETP